MARKFYRRRAYNRAKYYGGRFRSGWNRANNYRTKRGGFGLQLSPWFIVGAIVGITNIDDKLPKELVLAGAVIPVRGTGIGQIKAFTQGVICGNLIQSKLGLFQTGTAVTSTAGNSGFGV